MRDFVYIAPTPVDEDCAQVGTDNYMERARKECNAFRNQLRRVFGAEPEGAEIKIKREDGHDAGSYLEVVCWYNENYPESVDYAFKLEGETPERWDEEAKRELGL